MSSDDFHIGGEIEIRPPVPAGKLAGKLAGSKFLPDTAKDQGSEVFVIIDGAHRSIIVPTDPEGITGYPDSVIDDVAALITLIGDGHTYHGALRIEDPAGLANGNPPSRVRIVNGGDGWVVAREQSEYVYPADYTIPNGPAVAFDRDAATAWLTETVLVGGVETVRADEFGIEAQGMYRPHHDDSPADWLDRLLAELTHTTPAAPHVWRCAPGVDVEIVETVGSLGYRDGGGVLIVEVGRMRLASRWLDDGDLATYDEDGPHQPKVTQIDAAVEALESAARIVNDMVERHRLAMATAVAAANPFQRGLLALFPPADVETALLTLADLWINTGGADPHDVLSAHQREVASRIAAVAAGEEPSDDADAAGLR